MTPSIAPSGSSTVVLPYFAKAPELTSDIERRSHQFAQRILRTHPIAEEVVHTFKNPLSCKAESPRVEKLARLMGDLINPKLLDQIIGAANRYDLQERYLFGFAKCVEWLGACELLPQKPWLEALVLQSMLPIYLTKSKETVTTDAVTSLSMMRKSACLVIWSRLLEDQGASEWLHQRFVEGQCLETSLLNSFRLSMPIVSSQYWTAVGIPPASLPNGSQSGYWELATQLAKRTTEIRIPKSVSLGVVSWEKVLRHWESIVAVLSETSTHEVDHRVNIQGPVHGVLQTNQSETARSQATGVTSSHDHPTRQKDKRLVEIRTGSDPQLRNNLDQLLQQCRSEQTTLSMAVVSRLGQAGSEPSGQWHSSFIDALMEQSEASDLKGFVTEAGELALVFADVDRSQLSHWIRESFGSMNRHKPKSGMVTADVDPLVAGIAMVNAPARAFRIDQLIDSAWRCMDGAAIQGTHAVKTIEVY
jgi:hypothetical protein